MDAPVQPRVPTARRRRQHLRRHDPARQRARRHQPLAGVPRLRVRPGAGRRRPPPHAGGRQPVRAHARRAGAARGARREDRRALRRALRPGHRDHGDVGRHRGALRHHLGVRAPGRRGRARRAVLRRVRPGGPPERRHAALRDAARARLPHRLGRDAPRRVAPHAPGHRQLAAQPDGRRARRGGRRISWPPCSTAPTPSS